MKIKLLHMNMRLLLYKWHAWGQPTHTHTHGRSKANRQKSLINSCVVTIPTHKLPTKHDSRFDKANINTLITATLCAEHVFALLLKPWLNLRYSAANIRIFCQRCSESGQSSSVLVSSNCKNFFDHGTTFPAINICFARREYDLGFFGGI